MARPTIAGEVHASWFVPGTGAVDLGALAWEGTVRAIVLAAGSSGSDIASAAVGGVAMSRVATQASGRGQSVWLLDDLSGVASGDHVVVGVVAGGYLGGASAFALAADGPVVVVDSAAAYAGGAVFTSTFDFDPGDHAEADCIAFGAAGGHSPCAPGSGGTLEASDSTASHGWCTYRDDASPATVVATEPGAWEPWAPGIYHAAALFASGAATIAPAALGMEWGVTDPGPSVEVSADVALHPFPGIGWEWAVVAPGPRIRPSGPRHFMLTGAGIETPEMTTPFRADGSPAQDGDVPTWHTDRAPTLEAPAAGGGSPSDEDPAPIGTADAGASDEYSRGDHVHPAAAAEVTYDSGASGLTADDVQAAIDELAATPAGASLVVRDESDTASEDPVDTLVFPDGTVVPNGDGSVLVREVPSGAVAASAEDTTSGTLGTASTSFVDLTTAMDLTLRAYVGARILCWINGLAANEAHGLYIDAAIRVGGSVVRYLSSGTATPANGVPGWWPYPGLNMLVGAPIMFTVQAGDLEDGAVTLRLRARSSDGSTRSVIASSAYPFRFQAVLLGAGNVTGLDSARARHTSGHLTLNSTSWADVDAGLDLVVPAQAGDVLLIDVTGWAGSLAGVGLGIDVVTVVAGSPVSSVSGSGASDYGFIYDGVGEDDVRGSIQYVVVAGDISGGMVRLRLRYRQSGSGNRTLYAGTGGDPQFNWSVVNLRSGQRGGYDTGWHYVGGSGEPAFANGWTDYGAWGDAAFRRIDGIVYLAGLVKGGSDGATIFTLPAGYRPDQTTGMTAAHLFAVIAGGGMGRIDVYPDGRVAANGLNTSWVSLNSIRFPAAS